MILENDLLRKEFCRPDKEEGATDLKNYTVRSFINSALYIRMRGKRNACKSLIGSFQTKRPHKKYTLRWEDNTEVYLR
jgi:hypothetical protein